jgi:ribosomal protein S18 acetylase RimI-like enzyme
VLIEPLRPEHVDAVADLHMATLTGLITVLGHATARSFYQGCAESPLAVGFVAIDDHRVEGFVLGSTAPAALKRDVVARRPIATAFAMTGGILRDPRAVAWLMKSFRGPDEGSYDADAAELTYLAVAPEARGHGAGKQLVDAFSTALRAKGIRSYELSVDDDNKGAAAFYERNGFAEIGRYREFGKVHIRYRRDTFVSRS